MAKKSFLGEVNFKEFKLQHRKKVSPRRIWDKVLKNGPSKICEDSL